MVQGWIMLMLLSREQRALYDRELHCRPSERSILSGSKFRAECLVSTEAGPYFRVSRMTYCTARVKQVWVRTGMLYTRS